MGCVEEKCHSGWSLERSLRKIWKYEIRFWGSHPALWFKDRTKENFKVIYYALEMKSYVSVSSWVSKDLKSLFTFQCCLDIGYYYVCFFLSKHSFMSLAKRQLVFLWITSNFSTRTPTTYSTKESGCLDLAQNFHSLMSNINS